MATQKNKKSKFTFWRKHFSAIGWWEIAVLALSVIGIAVGVIAFISDGKSSFLDAFYNTFRLFLLNPHEPKLSGLQLIAQWLIFGAFFLVTFKVFVTIIIPKLLNYYRTWKSRNHTIICGLNAVSIELIKKNAHSKIVVIASENNEYTESLNQRNIKLIVGDAADESVLKLSNIKSANKIYILTENDKKNVDIAQTAFSICKEDRKMVNPLKCYTLINDTILKVILEDVALFKYTVEENARFCFDAILFNINEAGIKYGINTNIDKIWAKTKDEAPNILIVGLTEKTKNVILNLAHCMTMNKKHIHFYVRERDKDVIGKFLRNNGYLNDFANITFVDNNDETKDIAFSSIFVCMDNHLESIKWAVRIRNLLGNNDTNVITFYDGFDNLNEILNKQGKGVLSFNERNIILINTFEETVKYVLELDEKGDIEIWAEKAHDMWRKKDNNGNFVKNDSYQRTAEHFKQSNRNQVFDFYLKTYIALGETFDSVRGKYAGWFSEDDKKTLAIIEHRRWMLEKYADGWKFGETRDNDFKIHPDLQAWEHLSDNTKEKDYKAVNLMIEKLCKHNTPLNQ